MFDIFLNGQVEKNDSCQALESTCIMVCSSRLFLSIFDLLFFLVSSCRWCCCCCWVSVSGRVRGRWTTCRATDPLRAHHAICVHTETNGITHATLLQKRDPSSCCSCVLERKRVDWTTKKNRSRHLRFWSNSFHWLESCLCKSLGRKKISLTAANYR